MSPYLRTVKTSSGATAVQIVEKKHGTRRIVEHLGSAHTPEDVALLKVAGRQKLAGSEPELDLGLEPEPDRGRPSADAAHDGATLEVPESRVRCAPAW